MDNYLPNFDRVNDFAPVGPRDDCWLDDQIALRLPEYEADPDRVNDAAFDVAASKLRGGDDYAADMIVALHALSIVPADKLVGSDALAAALRLASAIRDDVREALSAQAEADIEEEFRQ